MKDYEKLYKEAIHRASGFRTQEYKDVAEYIFPELAESEDERIRKELLNYLYDVHDDDEERARWIAWLEKHGEHANFRNKIQIGDKVTRNRDGVLINLSQLKRVENKDEKQVEQKPAWSEEDELFVHGLIRGLTAKRDIHGHTTFSSDCIDITETINWLKSLKDRMQPKQEWSEEDKTWFNEVWRCVSKEYPLTNSYIFQWLKSLRPQNRWRPSDEQIEILDMVLSNESMDDNVARILRDIREQLKKLREE